MNENSQAPVVIIGTGLSGYSLAREVRKLDKDIPLLLVTADDGASYSKPMLSTGFTKEKTADALAMADAQKMADQLNLQVRTFAQVTAIDGDAHCIHLGDESIAYHKLVLAWGADVIRLQLDGDATDRVYSINDLMDYRSFREAVDGHQRVAILGAGLIGCEFANDLRNGGFEVDVIAPSDTVLPGLLPPQAAAAVQRGLTDGGVRFHLGKAATAVNGDAAGVSLTLDDGSTLAADIVISAVGLRPRTELAAKAGLEVGRGIKVNRQLQTSVADIYAMGDCAEVEGHVLLYVLPLMASARALAKTLTSEPTAVSYGSMPVLIKTPSCPTVVSPPAAGAQGEWQEEVDGNSVRALFRAPDNTLLGFAVTGDYVAEKQALSREVPAILP
ncbi:MAG: FAD-dependent oxidoreductase [Halomonadaceae bacterium]|nr:MAG: FAD-dependent oxidoreductase [Halomonadaceae bacterium]